MIEKKLKIKYSRKISPLSIEQKKHLEKTKACPQLVVRGGGGDDKIFSSHKASYPLFVEKKPLGETKNMSQTCNINFSIEEV